jgi:DHA1 family inner membrane transport protein
MSTRALLRLLAFANFIIGMGAFVVVGVLSPIAEAFGVSVGGAGRLMTIYGLIYALSSPILVALTGSIDRARIIGVGLLVFFCGSLLACLAPSFQLLLVARAAMAIGGGLVTPVAASIGAGLVAPEHRGRALATVFAGFTLAQVFGVPAGAWLGYAFGWRVAFGAVALMAAVGAAVLFRMTPRNISVPTTSLRTLAEVLATPRLLLAISLTALFFGALYALYTYLGPFLEQRHGLGRDGVTIVLVILGVAAVVGNGVGGLLTDRIGPGRTLAILCIAECVIMPFLTLVDTPLLATAADIAVWSVFSFAFMAAQQARLVALDPARTSTLFALNASAIYLGGSIGAMFGGYALKAAGVQALGPVGALMAFAGLVSMGLVARMSRQKLAA